MSRAAGPDGSRPPLRVTRAVSIPDRVRLARFRHAPELGSRILFFSGGTALRALSRTLVHYTHHSRHIITPFDSGGSSAKLRKAFRMPAVGDLRNRLMALADTSVLGNPEIYELFAFRFPSDESPEELVKRLDRLIAGRAARIREVPTPLRSIVRRHLGFFREAMPEDFDLRGAAIGNLILAGGYLNQGRKLDSVLYLFSQLVEVRGTVRPVVDKNLHLAAILADGREVVGQHAMTGKEGSPLSSPVQRLLLTRSAKRIREVRPDIPEPVDQLIRTADLICYPMGSFYTSVIANLLPAGVGDAVAETWVPKVYVPNTGYDPEEVGMDLVDKVSTLLHYLREGCAHPVETSRLLRFVVLDSRMDGVSQTEIEDVRGLGVEVIVTELVSDERAPFIDEERLAQVLLSLV